MKRSRRKHVVIGLVTSAAVPILCVLGLLLQPHPSSKSGNHSREKSLGEQPEGAKQPRNPPLQVKNPSQAHPPGLADSGDLTDVPPPAWKPVTFPQGRHATSVGDRPIVNVEREGQPPIRYVDAEVVLRFPRNLAREGQNAILEKYGLHREQQDDVLSKLRAVKARILDGRVVRDVLRQIITNEPTLRTPEPNYVMDLMATEDAQDPLLEHQYYVRASKFHEVWKVLKSDREVIVAIVDTGVDFEHPDLEARLLPGLNLLEPEAPPQDDNGHGTFLTGIIAARWNDKGIRGLSRTARVLPLKAILNGCSSHSPSSRRPL